MAESCISSEMMAAASINDQPIVCFSLSSVCTQLRNFPVTALDWPQCGALFNGTVELCGRKAKSRRVRRFTLLWNRCGTVVPEPERDRMIRGRVALVQRHGRRWQSKRRLFRWEMIQHFVDSLIQFLFVLLRFIGERFLRDAAPDQLLVMGVIQVQDQ